MKKVAFFVTSLNSGGIENYLLRFLSFYKDKVHATVICKGGNYGELFDKYNLLENTFLSKIEVGFLNPFSLYKIYKQLKNENYDSVCDFTGNFSGNILLVAKLAGVNKRVVFYRGSSNRFKETRLKLRYNSIMKSLVLNNSTKILSNSKSALDNFFPKRMNNDYRYKVVYNGIDIKKFLNIEPFKKSNFGIPKNSFVVGHVGRHHFSKNHSTILEVADILLKKYPSIYFILSGKDTDKHLQPLIENKEWKSRMKILGYRDDINKILPVFDLFFFPSITEGQPNSLIEAMSFNLPVVASNIPSIVETTPPELHPYLKEINDVNGYCSEIEKLYLDKNKLEKSNNREWVEDNFMADKLFNEFFIEI